MYKINMKDSTLPLHATVQKKVGNSSDFDTIPPTKPSKKLSV